MTWMDLYIKIFTSYNSNTSLIRLQTPTNFICECVCLSVSVTLLQLILYLLWVGFMINLGENVGTLVRLIVHVSKFHCATLLRLCATRKSRNRSKRQTFFRHFYVFQRILSRLRHTFSFMSVKRKMRASKATRWEREYAAPNCDTSNSNLLVLVCMQYWTTILIIFFFPCCKLFTSPHAQNIKNITVTLCVIQFLVICNFP